MATNDRGMSRNDKNDVERNVYALDGPETASIADPAVFSYPVVLRP